MARQKTSSTRSGAIRSTSGKMETAGLTWAVREKSRRSMLSSSCKARSSADCAPLGSVAASPSARNVQAYARSEAAGNAAVIRRARVGSLRASHRQILGATVNRQIGSSS
jgi:hypothetical protein